MATVVVTLIVWVSLPEPPRRQLTDAQRIELKQFLSETESKLPFMEPNTELPVVPANDPRLKLNPNDRVIGLKINGKARAYPLNVINTPERKVINDDLGGEPVLVTWCDLCHTAAVFSRTFGDGVDSFACSGFLWHGMLVMHDVRTGSFWNPLVGKALAGMRSGESLKPIDVAMTSWHQWLAANPDTTVVLGDHVSQDLTTDYYDAQKDQGAWVFGAQESGKTQAWTLEYLRANPVIETRVDGLPAVVLYDATSVTARLYFSTVDGETLSFKATPGGTILDERSNSKWNVLSGRAVEGPMLGKTLTPIPSVWAFESFWKDLLPAAAIEHATSVEHSASSHGKSGG